MFCSVPVNSIEMEENQNIGSKLLCKQEIYYSPQLLNGINFIKKQLSTHKKLYSSFGITCRGRINVNLGLLLYCLWANDSPGGRATQARWLKSQKTQKLFQRMPLHANFQAFA